ncbi:MAG: response regulator transcription factor [Bacteroidota bacterium]
MNEIKIVLVDDHDIVRDGLKVLLMNLPDIEVIGEVATGANLFDLLLVKKPDIILMDIMLPKISGITLTEKLSREHPEIKVIILTANVDDDTIINSFKAGALGYLTKNIHREELIEAIKVVNEGNEYLANSISKVVLNNYKRANESTSCEIHEMTKREVEIIRLFAQGLSYKEIADKLNISVRTVEAHKNHIFGKLQFHSIVDLVIYAIKHEIINI